MSLSTLNPVLPPVSARNVAQPLSPGMQYNAANTTQPVNKGKGGDDYDWSALKAALTSGVIKVGVDKFALKEGGELTSSSTLMKGGAQAVSSYIAAMVRERVQAVMPATVSDMSASTMDSLVAGALYVVIAKFGLGKDENMLKAFLTSVLSDFGAKMIYGSRK